MMRNDERSHECSACGGTGRQDTDAFGSPHGKRVRIYPGPTIECLCGREWPCLCAPPCPVCLGSRRCSDVRTARDAMVDAETLRTIASQNDAPGAWDAFTAGCAGERVADCLEYGLDAHASYHARYGARAAFRAVPGLRGE